MSKKALTIIVTYNGAKWLPTCMEGYAGIREWSDLVVVDNASTDNTVDIIKDKYADLVDYLLTENGNLGFGKAHNLVFSAPWAQQYDYYFLLNQDASIEADSFRLLLQTAAANPDFGILSPLHRYTDERLDFRFERYVSGSLKRQAGKSLVDVNFVNAAIWLIDRRLIERIGGFNPVFAHYGEDANFAERTKLAGFKIGVVPAATGYHLREQLPSKSNIDRSPYKQKTVAIAALVSPRGSFRSNLLEVVRQYTLLIGKLTLRGRFDKAGQHAAQLVELMKNTAYYKKYHVLQFSFGDIL